MTTYSRPVKRVDPDIPIDSDWRILYQGECEARQMLLSYGADSNLRGHSQWLWAPFTIRSERCAA